MKSFGRSARLQPCCPNCCRSTAETGCSGWARKLCASTPLKRRSGPDAAGRRCVDGGYVRSRHRQEERHFEVIAGRVIAHD